MSKKNKILFSIFALPTLLPLVAISCKTKSVEDEIKKINISITSKNREAKDVKLEDIIVSNYDKAYFTVSKIEVQPKSGLETTLEIVVELQNIKSKQTAVRQFTIEGFKENPAKVAKKELEEDLIKVQIEEIEAKSTKIASSITSSDIKVKGVDEQKYDLFVNVKVDKNDNSKLLVTVTLKNKKNLSVSGKKDFTIEGFKVVSAEEQKILEDLEKVSKLVAVDVLDKNKLAKEVQIEDLKFSNFDETTYEIVEKSVSVSKTDSKILEVFFKLKHKASNLLSNKRNKEVSGFKEEIVADTDILELKAILEKGSVSYNDPKAAIISAADLEESKLQFNAENNNPLPTDVSLSSIKFEKPTVSRVEVNSGRRTIIVELTKNGKVANKVFTLTCKESDFDIIINQREKIVEENFELIQTKEAKAALEALLGSNTLATLYYDFTGVFKDKKYGEADRKDILSRKGDFKFGTVFECEIIKNSENNYSLKIKIGKYDKNHNPKWLYDWKEYTLSDYSYNFVDKEALNKVALENKTKIDYPDKQSVLVSELDQSKIILPTDVKVFSNNVTFVVENVDKDSEHNTATIHYYAQATYNSEVIKSDIMTTIIEGFKVDELGKEFEGMSIAYENMATTLPSAIDQSQIKLMKNSEAYIVPADIISTITITSKDEYTGKVVIKVTFEKAGKKVEKEFELQFNKKPLDLNSLTLDSTLNIEGIVPNADTLASSILKENVKLTFKEEFANILEVVTYSLEAKEAEGKLVLSVEFKNKLNNETKTLNKEYTGFKIVSGTTNKFILQELYALSESKTLFHVKDEAKLKEKLLKLKDQPNDQRIEIKDNSITFSISRHSTALSTVLVLDQTVKGKVKTGSGQKNIGLAGKVGSSNKTNGINVHFYSDGKISFKWKLFLDNGQLDDVEYEQIVVNS